LASRLAFPVTASAVLRLFFADIWFAPLPEGLIARPFCREA
jgi:hypothetical protein